MAETYLSPKTRLIIGADNIAKIIISNENPTISIDNFFKYDLILIVESKAENLGFMTELSDDTSMANNSVTLLAAEYIPAK